MEGARQQVADLVHCSPEEVYYTSCGTESNNWAIWGVVAAARKNRGISVPHVVTSAVEHPAVLKYLAALKDQVWYCSYIYQIPHIVFIPSHSQVLNSALLCSSPYAANYKQSVHG